MAEWTTTTFDGLQIGNTVSLGDHIAECGAKGSTKDGLFVYLRGHGPVKVTSDEQIEVFR
jgi:hypothetical protein